MPLPSPRSPAAPSGARGAPPTGAARAGRRPAALGSTRKLGSAILAATSGTVLASEVRHGDGSLAVPRALLLMAALTGLRRRA